MTGWQTASLGEISTLISRGVAPKYVEDGGIAVLNQKCVRDHTVNTQFARRHDEIAKPVKTDRLVQRGDVLVNSTGTGTLGRVGIVSDAFDEPTTVDTHVTIVRPKPDTFVPKFFGYMMVSIEDQLKAAGVGTSGQTELSRTSIENEFRVSFPTNLAEQQRIVGILDQAFEGIAKAKANAERNLANAKELFESELEEVFSLQDPSWDNATLSEVCKKFGRGKSRHRPRNDPSLYGGDYPFIQTGDVRNSGDWITAYSQTYNEKGLAQSLLWPRGTLCITIAANIAEIGILDFDACFPDSIIGCVVNEEKTSNEYLCYVLRYYQAHLKAQGKGSAQDNINLATFENQKFPFPSLAVQDEIVEKLNSIWSSIEAYEANRQSAISGIADLRQSILHQAFSGKL